MIENSFVPNINIFSNSVPSVGLTQAPAASFKREFTGASETADFKSVLSGLVTNLNNEVEKPDQLLNQQMMGNSEVDIHDVITAVAKAELGISLATQITSKVVTAYNAVMNISI